MKIGVLICVLIVFVSASSRSIVGTGAFEEARRIGEGNERSFFLFSTTIGHYVVRHDGMGEVSINARRRVFFLPLGKARLEKVYFHEYQGEVVFLYSVSNGTSYVARMNQQSRKMRWVTRIEEMDIATCAVEGAEAHCGTTDEMTKINLNSGSISN